MLRYSKGTGSLRSFSIEYMPGTSGTYYMLTQTHMGLSLEWISYSLKIILK